MSEILYRPNLEYEKNYKSDGNISNDSDVGSSAPSQPIETIDDIQNNYDRIKDLIPTIPEEIRKALTVPLRAIQYAINQINPDYYDPEYQSEKSKITYTPPEKKPITNNIETNNNSGNDPFDDFPKSVFADVPIWDIKVEKLDSHEKIEKEYNKHLSDIIKDYVSNLEKIINKYLSARVVTVANAGRGSMRSSSTYYEGKSTELKNKDLMHVSDSIARIQIVKDQKLRMYKKLFTEEENITHLRACKVAKELKQRYYNEEACANTTILDLMRNSMLESSKLTYDKKYKENLYNLYKYLNSSVILINECFNLHVQEIQAKAILFKEEGSNT